MSFKDKVLEAIGIGTPGGIDDIFIRAVKAAVYAFGGGVGLGATPVFDVPTAKVALIAAATSFVSVIGNALLLWAKPSD